MALTPARLLQLSRTAPWLMPETATSPTLLDELDQRQEEVLAQLDELNARIEKLLEEYTLTRLHEPASTA